jgi:hypothetical protein
MNTPARISLQPVPELVELVRALARRHEAEDYARLQQRKANR